MVNAGSACPSHAEMTAIGTACACMMLAQECRASCNPHTHFPSSDLMLLDSLELKGVWGGRDYPLFAIDLQSSDGVNKAFKKFRHEVLPNDIMELRQACYESDGWPFCIYLPNALTNHFGATRDDPLGDYMKTATTEYSGMESEAEEVPDAVELRPDAPTS